MCLPFAARCGKSASNPKYVQARQQDLFIGSTIAYLHNMKTLAWAIAATLVALSSPAGAQLISQRVEGDRRICIYYGSDRLPNDQLVARQLTLGAGQDCPSTAPYHDPDAPAPGNAMLVRETQENGQRLCVYGQSGLEWWMPIPFAAHCAMTPALLEAQQASASRQPGTR